MSTGRAIDHVGVAGRDLDRLAAAYEALGFTLTPRARHQDHMGTSNRLAQFRGRNFIELLEVDRPEKMLPHRPGFMSFGAFNRDFLRRREGLAFVVFRTEDTPADLAAWRARGLDAYEQFNFERLATLPDGETVTVSFELGFVTSPALPETLFFVCHNKAEELFWNPAYQAHANGAEEVTAVVLAAEAPEAAGVFLSALFDGEVADREGGVSVACGPHRIDVVRPEYLADRGWDARRGGGAGFAVRSPAKAGAVTPAEEAGGAFIEWVA